MARTLDRRQLVERSIIKKYRKELWNPFVLAVKRYELVREGDRIAVCISGGKDSMLLGKLMQQLHRVSDVPFDVQYLVMDPGYRAENRRQIEENAALLGLPIQVRASNIFSVTSKTDRSPCYLCARMRRGHLYAMAQELGCNKIALGHHFSDVVETTVMGMLYGGQIQGMMPKLHSTNFPGMELIRPMYCIHEEDIIAWARYNGLHFLQCACRFTESLADGQGASKRQEVKALLRELRRETPQVEKNVFRAIHNVQLDTFPSWKTGGEVHSFLEHYDDHLRPSGPDGEK